MEILVVEDDESIRNLIVSQLQDAGFEVVTAADGLEGLAAIRERRPDAVLLDINMPSMDGFTMLERMKNDPATSNLPVLMLSAQSSPEDIRRAVQLGADDYIGKPFESRQLLRRVDRMIRKITQA
ncbi:response regulator [Caulobacter henricii]|uniref:Two-component system response regulator n=1 Tax=Caulobacter henricii TaxID=69395 RepID=A0A0P0P0Z5_9CAUL|nr:response regulator [Caulobacter henricii]ALL14120.1 two-component system response regulator [Caulobacter henricii]